MAQNSAADAVDAGAQPTASFFEFREPPFATTPDSRFVYLDDARQRAFSQIIKAIGSAGELIAVVGEFGSGKTSLLLTITDAVSAMPDASLLHPKGICGCRTESSFNDILAACRDGAGFASLAPHLPASRYTTPAGADHRPTASVLLLDDADTLKPSVLGYIVRLHKLLIAKGATLTIVMAVTRLPRVLQDVALHTVPFAPDRVEMLAPFAARDIVPFIRHRLVAAGHAGLNPFSDEACARIAVMTGGRPALVTELCGLLIDMANREFAFPILPPLVDQAAGRLALRETNPSGNLTGSAAAHRVSSTEMRPLPAPAGDEKLPFDNGAAGPVSTPLPNPTPVAPTEDLEAAVSARPRRWPAWTAAAFAAATLVIFAVVGIRMAGFGVAPISPEPSEPAVADRLAPADPPAAVISAPIDAVTAVPPPLERDSGEPLLMAPAGVEEAPTDSQARAAPTADGTAADAPLMPVAELLQRGDALLARNDIASAGPFYRLAMEQGSGKGALRLAMTLDPLVLGARGLPGKRGRPEEALAWYERAAALGETDAIERRNRLQTWLREQEKPSPPRE